MTTTMQEEEGKTKSSNSYFFHHYLLFALMQYFCAEFFGYLFFFGIHVELCSFMFARRAPMSWFKLITKVIKICFCCCCCCSSAVCQCWSQRDSDHVWLSRNKKNDEQVKSWGWNERIMRRVWMKIKQKRNRNLRLNLFDFFLKKANHTHSTFTKLYFLHVEWTNSISASTIAKVIKKKKDTSIT